MIGCGILIAIQGKGAEMNIRLTVQDPQQTERLGRIYHYFVLALSYMMKK
jgi:hypothetical protein